jgi:type VI protein secretion system component Hcp
MAKIFLKLGEVMGSSTDPEHMQWIELLSCSFPPRGSTPATSALPPASNQRQLIELQCSKTFDVSSGALLRMANDGAASDSATVEFVDDDRVAQLRMSLGDVMLTSFSTRQGASDSVTEVFGLMCVLELSHPDPIPRKVPPDVYYIFNPATKRYESTAWGNNSK